MATSIDSVLAAIGPGDRDHVDQFLDYVMAVAEPTGATVYMLHVFTRDEYNDLVDQMDLRPTTSQLPPDELAARHDSLITGAAKFDERAVDYEIRGTIGDPETEVVRLAEEFDVDLMFIGGKARSPAGKAVFGDSAQQILLNAPCPVTYVQRD